MKYIISTGVFLIAIFAFSSQALAQWSYAGASIPYNVTTAPSITVTLNASPNTMTLPNDFTTLTWAITVGTATGCTATSTPYIASWDGAKNPAGGSELITGLSSGVYTFDIDCTNGPSSDMDSAVVVVNPPITECSDGVDNADPEDVLPDQNDPGCHVGDNINNAYVPSDDDETNAAQLPDLIAGSVTPTTAVVSTPTNFSATIANSGTASTGASFTNLFQFDDNADHSTVFASQTVSAGPISAGGNASPSVSYSFGTLGTWYVRACADKNSPGDVGTINESNENNNCGTWTSISVTSLPPPPTYFVTLDASPTPIFAGISSMLNYRGENVSNCVASATPVSATWTGVKTVLSSYTYENTGPLNTTTTFYISCDSVDGPKNAEKTVTVIPNGGGSVVTALLSVNGEERVNINLGESATLSWSCSPNTTNASGIGFSTGGVLNGSISVSPTRNTTYTLNCVKTTDPTGSGSAQATVLVKRKFLFIEF
ncbi:MAG: hypothetical protein QG674_313 [Patescibacteria group bacterium]|nr:hypothetical protein [Patescibacteria group bacterium]